MCVSVLKCRIENTDVRPKCVCVCARRVVEKRTLMAYARELCPTTAERTKGEFHLVWHHLSAVNNVFKQTGKKTVTMVLFFSIIIIIIIVLQCDDRRDLTIYLSVDRRCTLSYYFHVLRIYWRVFIPRTSSLYVCVLLLLQSLPPKHTREGHRRFFIIFHFGKQIKRLNIYIYYTNGFWRCKNI